MILFLILFGIAGTCSIVNKKFGEDAALVTAGALVAITFTIFALVGAS